MRSGVYFNINIPEYCASCGTALAIAGYDKATNFLTQASHRCNSCNTDFIYIVEEYDLSENIRKELKDSRC